MIEGKTGYVITDASKLKNLGWGYEVIPDFVSLLYEIRGEVTS